MTWLCYGTRAVPGPTPGGTPKELPSHSPDFKNKILVLKELHYCYYGVDGINVAIEILEFNLSHSVFFSGAHFSGYCEEGRGVARIPRVKN